MKFNEYQSHAIRTMPKIDSVESFQKALTEYGLGIAGESGETVEIIKKHVYQGHLLDTEKISAELGDVLRYLTFIATLLGITLDSVAKGNIEKLQKRYPNGFSKEASVNRKDE